MTQISPSSFSSTLQTSVDFPPGEPPALDPGHKYLTMCCTCCFRTFKVPVSCGDRFCDVCALSRRMRVRSRIDFLTTFGNVAKGARLKMITLTVKNQSDIRKMTNHMIHSFRKMRNSKYWKERVKGGLFVLEVTGKAGSWHVHIHAIVSSYWIEWKTVMSIWKRCSGGRGVYITNVGRKQATNYCAKYLSKQDKNEKEREDVSAGLKGKRLFQPFGTWVKVLRAFPKHVFKCVSCGASGLLVLDFLPSETVGGCGSIPRDWTYSQYGIQPGAIYDDDSAPF